MLKKKKYPQRLHHLETYNSSSLFLWIHPAVSPLVHLKGGDPLRSTWKQIQETFDHVGKPLKWTEKQINWVVLVMVLGGGGRWGWIWSHWIPLGPVFPMAPSFFGPHHSLDSGEVGRGWLARLLLPCINWAIRNMLCSSAYASLDSNLGSDVVVKL